MPTDLIRLTADQISLDEVLREIDQPVSAGDDPSSDRETGAVVTFSGVVREREGEGTIEHLDYEHYAGMAEKETGLLVAEARRRWPLRRVAVVHRVGAVPVGRSSVIVVVAAGHRAEAFAAARFLIDELKKSVPIWKSAPNH